MKKYIFFCLSLVFFISSCNDLDLDPPTKIAAGTFWKNENDVKMGLAGCYARLKGDYLNFKRTYFDAIVDNGFAQHYQSCRNMQTGTLSKSSPGVTFEFYKSCYKGIATCNDFLVKYKQVELTPEKAQEYEAQVRFLRAYYYNELVQRFGGVVVYTEIPETLDGLFIPRSSEDEVYTLILKDLEYAINYLPKEAYTDGHAVQSSALALKGRIALFRKQWDEVITITKELIEPSAGTPLYQLADDLESQFVKSKGQDNCREIIFSVKYLESKAGRQSDDGGQEVEFFRWSGLQPTQDLMSEYEVGDKRLDEWYFQPEGAKGYKRPNGEIFDVEGPFFTGWGIVKFLDKDDDGRYIKNERDIPTGHDVVLIRLADVMLMYAEAMVEKGNGTTSDALAVKCVNAIRDRAGISHDLTSVTREIVRKERRLELAFEGFRHLDVARWKVGDQINDKVIYGNVKLKWEDKFYMWPFSQSEEDINTHLKGNNNPGY